MTEKKQPLLPPILFLFIGTMILANIAGQMDLPLRPLYVQELGANLSQIGLFFTLGAIAPLLFQIYGGWLSDSVGRLQAIAIGSLGGVVGYIIYIFAPSWEWLLIASVFSAVAFAFVGPSFSAFIAENSTEENRGKVYGLMQMMYTIVGVIGPPVGGLIAQGLNFKTMFIVAGTLYATAAGIRILMARHAGRSRPDQPRPEKPTFANLKSSLTAIFGMIMAGGIMTWIFITDGISDIAREMSVQLVPLYLENIMSLSLVEIGTLTSISSLAIMALSGFGGWLSDEKGERVGLMCGFAALAVSLAILIVGRAYITFAVAWVFLGAGQALIGPAHSSIISKVVPEKLRGTAFGLFATSLGIISLPAPWIGTQLWERFTPLAPFFVTMVAMALTVPIIWFTFKTPAEGTNKAVTAAD
ncbi:MAG: MFS transporter [Anaerolineae bacterium]|nr:MFS transporter [Anaerolineae bacterium]